MAHFIMNNNQTSINDTNLQNHLTHTRLSDGRIQTFLDMIDVEMG